MAPSKRLTLLGLVITSILVTNYVVVSLIWSRFGHLKLKSKSIKSILIWNKASRSDSGRHFGTGPEAFEVQGCPVTNCRIITKRTTFKFSKYDAIVFNMMDYASEEYPEDLDLKRRRHQRYIFLSSESPVQVDMDMTRFDNYFNWTMSYGRDSDILMLHGRVTPKASAPEDFKSAERLKQQTDKWAKNYLADKSKSVAWMVSNCETESQRETYVHELRRYIDVDIYGRCSNLSCQPNQTNRLTHSECFDSFAGRYKFYLSFENSVCRDYVTEKFFLPLAHDIVPVVYGGANYGQLAPPHSFIDALQFTPRQLARYLHQVGTNATLYNEYFWWKEHYHVEAGADQMVRHAYCDLCRKLHEDDTVKVYDNITEQWNPDARCMTKDPWNIGSKFGLQWFL